MKDHTVLPHVVRVVDGRTFPCWGEDPADAARAFTHRTGLRVVLVREACEPLIRHPHWLLRVAEWLVTRLP